MHSAYKLFGLALWTWLVVLSPASAAASDSSLRYDLRVDLPLLVVGGSTWLTAQLFGEQLAATSCHLCDPNLLDKRVRDGVVWGKTSGAAITSDVIGLGGLPALALLTAALLGYRQQRQDPWWVDAMIWGEAVSLNAGLNQIVKFAVARRRPFVQERIDAGRPHATSADDNVSFYSGHTSLAFSSVVAAGTLAMLRKRPYAPLIFAAGLPLAGFTGYLRMAADRHYLSDVLTGAVIGSALGAAVPLLHRPRQGEVALSLGRSATTIALTFRN